MKPRIAVVGLLGIVLGAAPAFAQERANIKSRREPKPREISVVEETYKGVVYSVGAGGRGTYLWKEIESLDYVSRPKELSQGIAAVRKGEYEEGLKLLQRFKAEKGLSPVFRQQALFRCAQAAESTGRVEEAIATYRQLLSDFKQSRFLQQANDRIVACLVATKKFDEAQKALAASRQAAIEARLDEELLREFDFLEAGLLESRGKLSEAANAYEKLSAAASSNPLVADLARIGAARCQYQKAGDASKAKAVCEEVINKANEGTSPVVMAAAWNGLGEVQLQEGRKDRKADKVREALFSVLRGVVQYFPAEHDRTIEYERSLFLSGQAFKSLADLTTDETQKKLNLLRAGEKLQELKNRYPLSPLNKE